MPLSTILNFISCTRHLKFLDLSEPSLDFSMISFTIAMNEIDYKVTLILVPQQLTYLLHESTVCTW